MSKYLLVFIFLLNLSSYNAFAGGEDIQNFYLRDYFETQESSCLAEIATKGTSICTYLFSDYCANDAHPNYKDAKVWVSIYRKKGNYKRVSEVKELLSCDKFETLYPYIKKFKTFHLNFRAKENKKYCLFYKKNGFKLKKELCTSF